MPSTVTRGRALYDGNIAVLDVSRSQTGTRLTYEASYYCDLIVSAFAEYKRQGQNSCFSSYSQFATAQSLDADRAYMTMVTSADVANAADLSRFALIIVPDIIAGTQEEILTSLGTTGRQSLVDYVRNGGVVYFSAKSLILAKKL